ncbi:NADH dehydrogenase [ubiquinone] iron-sulfur protein 4, mitochondrial [Lingula anatina]|uniref:NADH dehydrogenase [ubiquinone] iron-sulfur protein 4, mitochondrial n=1 Tax=Lingula anatina TaxID=7574 RepID=A0A1S3H0A7_LINAN|nr:NADH dehydrogenase [ubiquinone] iron-sulfur protein 4, mitochondrial [Lingula anatina]|eukprot:XP_013379438.1 NADH dehydrogenase [ubiquinone] iron-sulfur protein 4, mitochondrial [Lingula anatina]
MASLLLRRAGSVLRNNSSIRNLCGSRVLQASDDDVYAVEVIDKKSGSALIEVEENVETGVISGAPVEHVKGRHARIFVPAMNAMQSGSAATRLWRLEYDTRERWENPLMGWSSSGDPLSNIVLEFSSQEDAVRHAERMGYKYHVEAPTQKVLRKKSYGANFAWNKKTRVSTK